MRETVREVTRETVRRARTRGRPALARTVRLSAAAVVAYVIAAALSLEPRPLTGPLTALLVVQATLFSTLTIGLKRVLSVVTGVVLAVLFSSFFGLTWWSLGTIIAMALLAGHVLRLGEFVLETPISAMLVLGLARPETVATSRVVETLIGAGVGIAVNLVVPPPVRTRNAASSVERVADEAARVLERVAEQLPAGLDRSTALGWLDDCRALSRHVDRADRDLREAAESRRLNLRAAGTRDAQPILRSGLDALERSVVSLRALFRSLADGVPDDAPEAQEPYAEDVRLAFGVLLHDLASTIRAFGRLVVLDAGPGATDAEQALTTTLEALRETRARITDLLMVDAREDGTLWLLRGSLLAAVERVLRELDVEERARRRRQWQEEAERLGRAHHTAARLRDTSRQVAERPRGRRRAGGG